MMDLLALGKKLPAWELETILGDQVPTIEDYHGKALLILFFNLGCPGCKVRALPYANRMVVERGDNLNVIGIHTCFHGPEHPLEAFVAAKEKYFVRFPFFKDADQRSTYDKYAAGGTPHWLLCDAQSILQYSIFGSDPDNALLRLDLRISEILD